LPAQHPPKLDFCRAAHNTPLTLPQHARAWVVELKSMELTIHVSTAKGHWNLNTMLTQSSPLVRRLGRHQMSAKLPRTSRSTT